MIAYWRSLVYTVLKNWGVFYYITFCSIIARAVHWCSNRIGAGFWERTCLPHTKSIVFSIVLYCILSYWIVLYWIYRKMKKIVVVGTHKHKGTGRTVHEDVVDVDEDKSIINDGVYYCLHRYTSWLSQDECTSAVLTRHVIQLLPAIALTGTLDGI